MSTPNVLNNYPYPDSTGQIVRALFPNVDLFTEDDEAEGRFREEESVVRFNSIVKAPGIVAKKGSENVFLAPAGITGNQITISAGIGYTKNGARIVLPSSLSILDATALPGYVASLGTSLFLALRKNTQDYANRSNAITGAVLPTRRRLLIDSSIVEWVTEADILADRDIVVLGKRLTNAVFTFDLTEATGRRVVLRVTEVPTLDTTGGTMFGDIDMQRSYEILNLPDINSPRWRYIGAATKKDLIRSYAKSNYTLGILGEVIFEQNGNDYRLRFGSSSGVKIKLFGNQRPPVSINIIQSGNALNVPDNHVVQILLTDAQLLASSSLPTETDNGEFSETEIDGDAITNPAFQTAAFDSTSNNFDFHKIPIGFHSVLNGVHKFVFANGVTLDLGESIDDDGKYTGYVRRDGESTMTGSLRIKKNGGLVQLIQSTALSSGTIYPGINWENEDEVKVSSLYRIRTAEEQDSSIPGVTLVNGDMVLSLGKENGGDVKYLVFKQDGRIQQPNKAAASDIDLVRLGELNTLLTTKYNVTGGTITGDVLIQKINPKIKLIHKGGVSDEDGPGISEVNPMGSLEWFNKDGVFIGGIARRVAGGDFGDGDLEFTSATRDGASLNRILFRRAQNALDVGNILIGGTAAIGKSVNFYPTDELPHTDTASEYIKFIAPTGSAVYNNHLHPQVFAKQKINGVVQSAALLNWPAPLRTLSNAATLTTSDQLICTTLADAVPWQGQYLLIVTVNYSYDYVSPNTNNNFIIARVVDRVSANVLPGAQFFTSSAGGTNSNPVQNSFQFTFVVNLIPSEVLRLFLKANFNWGTLAVQSANMQLIHLF